MACSAAPQSETYLYLDLNTCDRCIGADAVLEEVLGSIAPALEAAGYTMRLQKV
ncbi:MAG: DUF2703 domain-containing protein, partial [Oscillospiraceae bacterium]|nr:DUF2703 domain-containing protein [Oscillospiraceae bacterium]